MVKRFLPLLLLAAVTAVGQSPSGPDAELWQTIVARRAALSSEAVARGPRVALLEAVRDYRTYYPGGRNADAATRLAFDLMFELGAMDGDFSELRRACQKPASEGVQASEAAYWKMVLDRVELDREATRALPGPLEATSPFSGAAAEFVRKFPKSRHTPGLVWALFEEDAGPGRLTRAELVELLKEHHPAHMLTRILAARLGREARLGRPIVIRGTSISGEPVDSGSWAGQSTLVVFFSVANSESMARLRDAATLCKARNMRLIGVHVGLRRDDAKAALDTSGIACPVLCDEAGLFGALAQEWGVTSAGLVLVVDAGGRLRAIERENWRQMADAVAN
ncbi:MAG: hypothetical protein KDA32_04645 [Phycisphaerales bacterium]|nr:hypothetical protein [Phycisphaerales bacterium]